jgi:hypothetical protein
MWEEKLSSYEFELIGKEAVKTHFAVLDIEAKQVSMFLENPWNTHQYKIKPTSYISLVDSAPMLLDDFMILYSCLKDVLLLRYREIEERTYMSVSSRKLIYDMYRKTCTMSSDMIEQEVCQFTKLQMLTNENDMLDAFITEKTLLGWVRGHEILFSFLLEITEVMKNKETLEALYSMTPKMRLRHGITFEIVLFRYGDDEHARAKEFPFELPFEYVAS